ncbi:MAG: hypothetical protein WC369_03885 [Dehalococcoidales bacterium]
MENLTKYEHFKKLRKEIATELLSANAHFNIISGFLDSPETNNAIIRKYQTFFNYTLLAHIKLLSISLYNVTKHKKQTGNIPRLLCYIKAHKNLLDEYTEDIAAIEDKLESHTTFLEDVYVLRNQHYAHNQLNSKELEKTLIEIRDGCQLLLPDLNEVYDSLSLRYDGTSIFWTFPNAREEVMELLADLTEYKKIKRQIK